MNCVSPLPARIVFSALDAEVAGPIEQEFAKAGAYVVTNTRTHRMEPDVPLMIPEANADHLSLIDRQHEERGWNGAILANPNCSTAALALALLPLHRAFGVERLFVSTMQAVSGAGYPGVASLDILGNVIPHIGGEEEKIERESRKILGTLSDGLVQPAEFAVSAHTNRVPVVDGHMMTVSVGFTRRVSPEEAVASPASASARHPAWQTFHRPRRLRSKSTIAPIGRSLVSTWIGVMAWLSQWDECEPARYWTFGWSCWATTPSAGQRARLCRSLSCSWQKVVSFEKPAPGPET